MDVWFDGRVGGRVCRRFVQFFMGRWRVRTRLFRQLVPITILIRFWQLARGVVHSMNCHADLPLEVFRLERLPLRGAGCIC